MWPTRTNRDVFLPIAPFTHIYGFMEGVLVPVSAQGETVIPERFQPEHIVELLARHRVTFFGGGPPAIYAGVSRLPRWSDAVEQAGRQWSVWVEDRHGAVPDL